MSVGLLVTCMNDALYPDTGRAVVTLLRRLGVEVDFPAAQTCCGQPMVNTGYLDEAVPLLRNHIAAFEGCEAIVVPSGSCAGSVRHQHRLVAERSGDPGLVRAVEQAPARPSWQRPPGRTCGRSSCAPRSPCPGRTSPSPRPGRSPSSRARATAGCA